MFFFRKKNVYFYVVYKNIHYICDHNEDVLLNKKMYHEKDFTIYFYDYYLTGKCTS